MPYSSPCMHRTVSRLASDTSGAAAVLVALAMPIVIGGIGLAVDVGLWYSTERRLQNAADMAAFTAALESGSESCDEIILDEARFKRNFRGADEDCTLTTESSGNHRRYRVTLAEDRPDIFFSVLQAILGRDGRDGKIRATAVAELDTTPSPPCVHALDRDANQAVRFQGTPVGDFENCSIYSNSRTPDAIHAGGNANLGASCAYTPGRVSGSLDLECGDAITGASSLPDPYENDERFRNLARDAPGNCTGERRGSTFTPGRHCGGISLRNPDGTVHFEEGVHYVDTEFSANFGENKGGITGESVTIVLLGDIDFKINGGDLDLQGGAEGLGDMLFYFDPEGPGRLTHRLAGNAEGQLGGVIYAPTGDVRYRGGASNNERCLRFVSQTVDFGGNSGIQSRCEDDDDEDAPGLQVRLAE